MWSGTKDRSSRHFSLLYPPPSSVLLEHDLFNNLSVFLNTVNKIKKEDIWERNAENLQYG